MKRFAVIIFSLGLAACQPNIQDLQQQMEKVRQNTSASIERYPQFNKMSPFVYQAQNLRSPFAHAKKGPTATPVVVQKNCLQPDFNRAKQPLEQFGIDAMEVKGSFTAKGKVWALIQTSDGGLYTLGVGDHLGLFFGKVTSITPSAVLFTEMLPDGTGCWQRKDASLTRLSKAGDKTNV